MYTPAHLPAIRVRVVEWDGEQDEGIKEEVCEHSLIQVVWFVMELPVSGEACLTTSSHRRISSFCGSIFLHAVPLNSNGFFFFFF